MAYLTDRKRAVGMGSAKTGTDHHWHMIISSVALLGLIPCFVFTFGHALGMEYSDALAYYHRPFPAILAVLTLMVGFLHFRNGVQTLIEDYMQGMARKVALIAMICLSYSAAAVGVFALIRIAL